MFLGGIEVRHRLKMGVNTTDDEDSLIYSRDHCQKFSQSRALSQLTFFTCSKSTIEILKKCVKYVQT